MELPFAVESSPGHATGSNLHQSDSSLVTASSQGSFINSGTLDSPLPPNTPQDVVLPRYDNLHHSQQPRIGGQLLTPAAEVDRLRKHVAAEPDVADFTYVDVCETDEDEVTILLEGLGSHNLQQETHRGDVLAVILSGMQHGENETLVKQTMNANEASMKASEAKKSGDLIDALEYHSQAAKMYRNLGIALREQNVSLSNSMLLLSQAQAKSALALKNIVKLSPAELQRVLPSSSTKGTDTQCASITQKDRLRAAVRGALGSRHPHEADLSDSQFLGNVTSESKESSPNLGSELQNMDDDGNDHEKGTLLAHGQESTPNPVDEMMELERELRDMDMALELGNSISSLDTRMQQRMKNSIVDGSFMVVPPGSNSYMSSSAMWGSGHIPSNPRPAPPANNSGTAGVRARANRVQQTKRGTSTATTNRHAHPPLSGVAAPSKNNSGGLESSWWGNASAASQILTSSVISVGSRTGGDIGNGVDMGQQANTKQLMRLMDSLKTLGDENAALLREVEEAEVARQEAKAAREQMKRFKTEYGKRFSKLKAALEKFRQDHPQGNSSDSDPVASSEFSRKASVADQLQRQEQLIRKLTSDLKKEKEESKKKDAALRKYESFYREVKARSAQKAAQRQMENQQRQHKTRHASTRAIR